MTPASLPPSRPAPSQPGSGLTWGPVVPRPRDITCRAAVLGSPIEHSLSPVLHRSAYERLGLHEWGYDRFAVGGEGEPGLREFLASRGPVDAQAVGEPRQAQAWLQRLAAQ